MRILSLLPTALLAAVAMGSHAQAQGQAVSYASTRIEAPGGVEIIKMPGSAEIINAPGGVEIIKTPGEVGIINAPGGVITSNLLRGARIEDEVPWRLLLSIGGVTFTVNERSVGTLAILRPSGSAPFQIGGGGMLFLGNLNIEMMAGVTFVSEALSLSSGGGAELGGRYGGQELALNVTLVLAQYN